MNEINNLNINSDLVIFIDKETLAYLSKLNINTLGELFDAYNNGVFNDKRKKYNKNIVGQIEFLMSYYLKTPLIASELLKESILLHEESNFYGSNSNKKLRDNLCRSGFTGDEYMLIGNYIVDKENEFIDRTGRKAEVKAIIEIINQFVNDEAYQLSLISQYHEKSGLQQSIRNIKMKCEICIKNIKFGRGHYDEVFTTIMDLEEQMKFLVNTRNRLDVQIELLQNQINNVKANGGLKK